MLRRNRVTFLVAGALTLAACGQGTSDAPSAGSAPTAPADKTFPGLTADQVLAKAQAAVATAESVHVSGALTQASKKVAFEINVVEGEGAAGVVKIDGAPINIRKIGEVMYAQPSDKFLESQGPMGKSLGDMLGKKWLKADEAIAAAAGLGDLGSGFNSPKATLDENLPKDVTFTRAAGKDVGGVSTTALKYTSAKQSGTLYIAATGTPYPLLLESSTLGTTTLSDWGKKASVTAPKAKDIVDIGELGLSGAS